MRPTLVLVAMISLMLSACVGPADRARLTEEQRPTDALEPSFSPLPSATTESEDTPDPTAASTATGPTPTAPAENPTSEPEAPEEPSPVEASPERSTPGDPAPIMARLDDPAGDVTGVGSPDWADLRGARLIRDGTTFTLTHVLVGSAPRQGDGQNTMNIATFFDIDGDGTIDYEIWANLSPNGWGTSYFDEREGTARYAADDDVDVEVVDGDVQLRFPTSHLADAPSFRWSIASEYGPYQAIGTDAMARDYLPDDRSGRPFPG